MSIRDLIAKARGTLHGAFLIPAHYHPHDRAVDTLGVPCTIRIHPEAKSFGDMSGFDYAPAERFSTVPQIVAKLAEVSPVREGVFMVSATEGWHVQVVEEPDLDEIKCQVTRLDADDLVAEPLSYPGMV